MKRVFVLLILLYSMLFAMPNYSLAQKEKKLYPLGKRILQHKCAFVKEKHFESLAALEHYVHEHCTLGEERYYDALALYVWERSNTHSKHPLPRFEYTKKDKCPVCGMFVYKYPAWVTMSVDKKGNRHYFDGIKDQLKYYFEHPRDGVRLYAKEYYTKKTIELHNAFFVIGSDVYGPMGDELIAFDSLLKAQRFMEDHKGKRIVRFSDLNKELVWSLDE